LKINEIGIYKSFGCCNGRAVYQNDRYQLFYISKSGKHQIIKTDCVLNEENRIIEMSDYDKVYNFLAPMDNVERYFIFFKLIFFYYLIL